MKQLFTCLFFSLFCFTLFAQNTYFPPNSGEEWETISPADLGWCTEEIEPLLQFLEDQNTNAFIVLKNGRIVIEAYFNDFTADKNWYWASAGKTLTAFLVGKAQEEGLLSISEPTQNYLGEGWTSASAEQEAAITIQHQLTMTTGLNDIDVDSNCLDSECLEYLTEPGTRWAYYNAPYRLLLDVVENASGQNYNQFGNQQLENVIGMSGFWLDYTYFSTARDMARFGVLLENEGMWNGQPTLEDNAYFNQMINTSQDLNLSYGYLTWLNGKASHQLPGIQFVFEEPMMLNAPDDLYAALGKNDQKLHVVPSQDLVVIRLGDASDLPFFAVSPFDNELWGYLNEVICESSTATNELKDYSINVMPNPFASQLLIESPNKKIEQLKIYNQMGQLLIEIEQPNASIDLSNLSNGIYFLQLFDEEANLLLSKKLMKTNNK